MMFQIQAGPVIKRIIGLCLLVTCFQLIADDKYARHNNRDDVVLAPGYSDLTYKAPDSGSYSLPPLGHAGDGRVLNTKGDATQLHDLMGDKVVLLSFIFSTCNDVNGCPLSTYVLGRVQDRVLKQPGLAEKLKIITLSFDPVLDSPEVMATYGSGYQSADFEWHFLTTRGNTDLDPILDAYNQSIIREEDENGEASGNISHILRVYLIDKKKRIRNIYSTAFLHADILLNDVHTLLQEQMTEDASGNVTPVIASPVLHGPGDNRTGYESREYQTQTISLQHRSGSRAELVKYLETPPLGLPAIRAPLGNEITREKIELGRLLFFDRRLSHNNTISCAMCHVPEQGFTSNEIATAVGVEGRTVKRNALTLYNVGYLDRLFHDGRESTLEQQIWGPLLAHNEMANPSVGRVIDKVEAIPEYAERFAGAFAGKAISMETLSMALASYERVLVSGNSAFDRWYFGGEGSALSSSEKQGFDIFKGKGNCVSCHTIDKDFALFTDQQLHNTGIGYRRSMDPGVDRRRVLVAPGQYLEVDLTTIEGAAEQTPNDLGRYEITGDPDDRWKYRTPGLRNVALTAPYMHDGSLSSLRDVVEFYNQGGVENELLDPRIKPLELDDTEIDNLVSFLQSLTGDNVDEIIADAFVTPVGNINN